MIESIIEYCYLILLLFISYKLIIYFNKVVKDDLCKI